MNERFFTDLRMIGDRMLAVEQELCPRTDARYMTGISLPGRTHSFAMVDGRYQCVECGKAGA